MARKKVNEELNLTTFIDLFSTLVCFLLITAVWNQIEALSTNIDNTTTSDSPSKASPVNLTVTILQKYIEMSENTKAYKIPYVSESLETGQVRQSVDTQKMIKVLDYWRRKYPNKKDIVLNTENSTPYRHMILTFDTMVGNDWPDIGVNTQ